MLGSYIEASAHRSETDRSGHDRDDCAARRWYRWCRWRPKEFALDPISPTWRNVGAGVPVNGDAMRFVCAALSALFDKLRPTFDGRRIQDSQTIGTNHRVTGYLTKHMRVIAKRYLARRSSRAGLSEERVLVQSDPKKPLATGYRHDSDPELGCDWYDNPRREFPFAPTAADATREGAYITGHTTSGINAPFRRPEPQAEPRQQKDG